LLDFIEFFHFFGEHFGDDENLLAQTLVLIDQNLLILDILLLFLLYPLSILSNVIS
jgi:hypothetical protein